jgi:TetR/AcrR family transcriptional regulator
VPPAPGDAAFGKTAFADFASSGNNRKGSGGNPGMQKKLTEEQQKALLENAISEFGERGLTAATVSSIAERSGISVGVIYKYYENKEALFEACLDASVSLLGDVLRSSVTKENSLEESVRGLIRASQNLAREHPSYFRMYHAITMRPDAKGASGYAERIERISAEIYTELISKAESEGIVRKDASSSMFAFFFDNLLMMLHFSYSCDYYRHRMEIYCGESADEDSFDERLADEMMKFLKGAFGGK